MQYSTVVKHRGLNRSKVITGSNSVIVEEKARLQAEVWEEEWRRRQEAERERNEKRDAAEADRASRVAAKEAERLAKQKAKEAADERTNEAESLLESTRALLRDAVGVSHVLRWETLEDRTPYPEPPPTAPRAPTPPSAPQAPPEPNMAAVQFEPAKLGVLDRLLPKRRRQKQLAATEHHQRRSEEAGIAYTRRVQDWKRAVEVLRQEHAMALAEHKRRAEEAQGKHKAACQEWEERHSKFQQAQDEANEQVRSQRDSYMAAEAGAVESYCEIVLLSSDYPFDFTRSVACSFNPENGILVLDYALPPPDSVPRLKAVKYVASQDRETETYLPEREMTRLYDDVLYQAALRSIHELFDADVVLVLRAVVFNGWVTSVDRASGKATTACILSLQAQREEFEAINLSEVEPKACFKSLKGVGSSQLHSLTPVAPVMMVDKEDARFVSSYAVADELGDTYNLAAMDWEDFEHLIREVFEKEFASGGGEVKVTRASRDGGVDAVAFDPDPIRGGKIVIQAKRYTNVVGVSAVRDLYGTVMNEGAIKGILVSTSDYGPDAYDFAKDKPLTLLSGANLLHLLERHGHRAKIDLNEAKAILAERDREARK